MKVCALLFALVAVAVAEGEDDEAVRSPPSVSNGACSALSKLLSARGAAACLTSARCAGRGAEVGGH